jgi:hypothetical protein
VGCGGAPAGLHAISGTVKLDGAPVEKGSIGFEPMSDQRTGGGAVIAAGNYAIPQAHGLAEGKYRVVVHAPAPGSEGKAAPNAAPGEAAPPPKDLIPPEWNESSTHTIEVTKQGPYVFPIEIATKGK